MRNISSYVNQHVGPLLVSGGLSYAIKFAEALAPELSRHGLSVIVSGISDGLFFRDMSRNLAIRITMNLTAGCGRMYVGTRSQFDFDTGYPDDSLELKAYDWEFGEIKNAVQKAVDFLAKGNHN